MSKSQNTKNEHRCIKQNEKSFTQKDLSLTELWQKGELPSRDDDHLWLAYYIKHNDGYIHADSLWRGHWGIADRNSIEEILAPVPSFDEYIELEERLRKTQELELKVRKQLAIAVEALNWYDGLEKMLIGWEITTGQERGTAEKALCEIEELENG